MFWYKEDNIPLLSFMEVIASNDNKAYYLSAVNTYIHYHHTSIGWLELTASETGLAALRIVDAKPEDHQNPLQPIIDKCCLQLDEYFNGSRKEFDLPLDFGEASDFYIKIWDYLTQIPYGSTTTYGHIAQTIGQANASQAVGQANGRNPIAIIVPCHRVIGSQGKLTGYAWGIEKKIQLLQLERSNSPTPPGQLF